MTGQRDKKRKPVGLVPAEAFARIAANTNLGPAWLKAAEQVLVYGRSQAEAARLAGLNHRNSAWLAVRAMRKALTRGERCVVCGSELKEGGEKHEHGPKEAACG
jgi:hypothetical protein